MITRGRSESGPILNRLTCYEYATKHTCVQHGAGTAGQASKPQGADKTKIEAHPVIEYEVAVWGQERWIHVGFGSLVSRGLYGHRILGWGGRQGAPAFGMSRKSLNRSAFSLSKSSADTGGRACTLKNANVRTGTSESENVWRGP
jgi:hypothetical protein